MHLGPPGWGLCSGLITHSCKTSSVTETPTRNLKDILALEEDGSPAGNMMKFRGESSIHLETHKPMAIISTRTTITFGTWNFRMTFEAGRTAQVAAEMRNYSSWTQ